MREKDVEPLNPAWRWLQICQSSAGQCDETEQLSSRDMYESHFLSLLHIFLWAIKLTIGLLKGKTDEICLFWMGTYLTNIAHTHSVLFSSRLQEISYSNVFKWDFYPTNTVSYCLICCVMNINQHRLNLYLIILLLIYPSIQNMSLKWLSCDSETYIVFHLKQNSNQFLKAIINKQVSLVPGKFLV